MALDQDAFETVAITWSQPEAAVMLSMFEFYGIPAFALGRLHASINPPWITGLQGIQVRVHHLAVDDALDLLSDVAARPAAVRPYFLGSATLYRTVVVSAFVLGIGAIIVNLVFDPGEQATILLPAFLPLWYLTTLVPPTRTPSTFMLWKRSRDAPTVS